MKLIDRITYITFVINIVAILFYFIGLPIILMTVPESFAKITEKGGQNPYNLSMTILSTIVFFHWVYCIWFLFKYDRYSKSIIPLFFFNVLYAPIYFYRVRIIKRPLRNKIDKPGYKVESDDQNISDDEFLEMTRNSILGVIDMWTSKENQLEFLKELEFAQISEELFIQWHEIYFPDSNDFQQAFNKEELLLLSDFDGALKSIALKTPDNLSSIEEFIKTQEWLEMNQVSIEIRDKLNMVGNPME